MQRSQDIDQSRCNAQITKIRQQLELGGSAYIQQVLDTSTTHLENAKEFIKQLKAQKPISKINWDTDKSQRLLARYKQLQLIPFSCKLAEHLHKDEHGRMVPKKK